MVVEAKLLSTGTLNCTIPPKSMCVTTAGKAKPKNDATVVEAKLLSTGTLNYTIPPKFLLQQVKPSQRTMLQWLKPSYSALVH